MKKEYLLLLVFICLALTMAGQRITPRIVVEGKTWNIHHYSPLTPDAAYYYSLVLRGDTVIAGKSCKKLYYAEYKNKTLDSYYAALYEEGKKVYCCYLNSAEFRLLYDFGCSVGDEYINPDTLKVEKIDTIVVGGQNLRRVYVSFEGTDRKNELEWACWIEGVGSYMMLIWPYAYPGNINHFVSCEENGEVVFTRDLFWGQGTGIGLPAVVPASDKAAVYDLSGRRLQEKPEKGLYIQNGRKWRAE